MHQRAWLRSGYAPEMKKGLRSRNPFFCLARPAGFEPTTSWFVARRSLRKPQLWSTTCAPPAVLCFGDPIRRFALGSEFELHNSASLSGPHVSRRGRALLACPSACASSAQYPPPSIRQKPAQSAEVGLRLPLLVIGRSRSRCKSSAGGFCHPAR